MGAHLFVCKAVMALSGLWSPEAGNEPFSAGPVSRLRSFMSLDETGPDARDFRLAVRLDADEFPLLGGSSRAEQDRRSTAAVLALPTAGRSEDPVELQEKQAGGKPPPPPAPNQGAPNQTHGTWSLGGQILYQHNSISVDSGGSSSTVSTDMLSFSVYASHFFDERLQHELGASWTISFTGSNGSQVTSQVFSVYYHYNIPIGNEFAFFIGGGLGVSVMSGDFRSTAFDFDIPIFGFRYFISPSASLDVTNKVSIGVGSTEGSSSTTVGYSLLIGFSIYLSK
jgi:hypothetical protein